MDPDLPALPVLLDSRVHLRPRGRLLSAPAPGRWGHHPGDQCFRTGLGRKQRSAGDHFPASRQIPPGGSTTFTLTVNPSAGYGETLTLEISATFPDLQLNLQPNSITPPGQSILTITDLLGGPSIPGRLYQLPVTASAPGISQAVRALLLVGGAALHLPIMLR